LKKFNIINYLKKNQSDIISVIIGTTVCITIIYISLNNSYDPNEDIHTNKKYIEVDYIDI
jgi:hypothetical protein